jgi:hypothetical protein
MTNDLATRYHESLDARYVRQAGGSAAASVVGAPMSAAEGGGISILLYDFQNFMSPFVGKLIEKLDNPVSGDPIGDMLAPTFLANPDDTVQEPSAQYQHIFDILHDYTFELDDPASPYVGYHWELCFHLLHAIAEVHHRNGRYDEELAMLRHILDTASTDAVAPPPKFWKFKYFRDHADSFLVSLLDTLADPNADHKAILQAFTTAMTTPFQPFAVARSRPVCFAYFTVMKLLDCYIAKADSLLANPTIEKVNECTQWVVKAANLLGPRPQRVPPIGTVAPKSYDQLGPASSRRDLLGDALVDLEAQFPFNLTTTTVQPSPGKGPLLGLGQTLYFCIPEDQRLLGYWDTVEDRLFKIRHCENLAGQVQLLPLFDPPIDPGLLVAATAAGLDIASAVAGLNQPISALRAPALIRKALEMAAELRTLGNELQAALDKKDTQHLAYLRQQNETNLQNLVIDTRKLQYQQAVAATNALAAQQKTAWERYNYYMYLNDQTAAQLYQLPQNTKITADNFEDAYQHLVGQFSADLAFPPTQQYPKLDLPQSAPAQTQAGGASPGPLHLNSSEDQELNHNMPDAKRFQLDAANNNKIAGVLSGLPGVNFQLKGEPWGLGFSAGTIFSEPFRFQAEESQSNAISAQADAASANRTGGHQRRAADWIFQLNVAAREIQAIGQQLMTSIIAQQAAAQEVSNAETQAADSQTVLDYMTTMFTGENLYAWMQDQLMTDYRKHYQFAVDLARRAETTAKWELMRPEFDANTYIQPNYFDSTWNGLLAGDALIYDINRLETDYNNYNLRELELTRSVSLRELAPLPLLALKLTGSCTVSIPEWFFDRDCPGLYMRRLKNVAVSIPAMVNQDNPLPVSLMLQNSTIRLNPTGPYKRTGTDDSRFRDYTGSVDSVVTSSALNDTGLFETNLRDERHLPFEGAGAISTWTISLPDIPAWDYTTMTDFKIVLRYTARDGGQDLAAKATPNVKGTLSQAMPPLLLSLRHDFPDEWWRFSSSDPTNPPPFTATLRIEHFPYMVSTVENLKFIRITVYDGQMVPATPPIVVPNDMTAKLKPPDGIYTLSLPSDPQVLTPSQPGDVYLVIDYQIAQW